ncbi:MAG TPA: ATP-dependent DNA helicase UvrD2 [Actinomycetota bacterium]|nr:ATP-dependent DNA helicase UvrD2 [Actinomycetota bacterium]
MGELHACDAILEGLNPEQAAAARAVRGPVCILAGAGSGKTTTITRRIAYQVATHAFRSGEILAVTFTDKAAGEMRARLAALGAEGVRARTFHAAALAQLRHLAPEEPPRILPSKAILLRQIGNSLPKPYRFRPAGDLATEIEWAKNRRIGPGEYATSLGGHVPPIPADLMAGVYREYERRKARENAMDFEDLLEATIRMFAEDEWALERFRTRYKAFTVDEYQDVNLLQQTLLEAWVGDRDDLCVVGDDYQSIYSFTGASPRYLLEMPRKWERTKVVRLEQNFRSTPQVLTLANRLVPKLGGAEKTLRPVLEDGPAPVVAPFVDRSSETKFLVDRIRELHASGVPYEEIAVLYRVNFRSEDYEDALGAAGIPFQVRDGAFLTRIAARRLLSTLRRSKSSDVFDEVLRAARRDGYQERPPEGLGDQETTRQNDLARLVRLAQEFDGDTAAEFVAHVEARFASDGEGHGVHLLTLHRAKGLEFEAVFLPRLEEGELPGKRSKTDDAIAEERRLLYVGLTRAKRHLYLTWTTGGRTAPSRFVEELGGCLVPHPLRQTKRRAEAAHDPVYQALKAWRLERAKRDGVPAYVIFHDTTLQEIAEASPASIVQLARISGVGPAKLDRYGNEVLATLKESVAS